MARRISRASTAKLEAAARSIDGRARRLGLTHNERITRRMIDAELHRRRAAKRTEQVREVMRALGLA